MTNGRGYVCKILSRHSSKLDANQRALFNDAKEGLFQRQVLRNCVPSPDSPFSGTLIPIGSFCDVIKIRQS